MRIGTLFVAMTALILNSYFGHLADFESKQLIYAPNADIWMSDQK